ncbi:MAG: toll/interleukin-1 receptor domain-containing protein [Litoreibacter sp.]
MNKSFDDDTTEDTQKRIFLCHANEDKIAVRAIHRKLIEEGFSPWLDEVDLLPGQDFESAIKKALEGSKCVMIFFSENSVKKRGFVQRELKHILRIIEEIPSGELFIVPVKLDDCDVPDEFSNLHWVNLAEPDAWKKIISTLGLIYNDQFIYESSGFFSQVYQDQHSAEQQTIDHLVALAEEATGKRVEDIKGVRQQQILNQWVSVAKFSSEDEPLLFNTWQNMLEEMLEGKVVDPIIIQSLQHFHEEDISFLMKFRKGRLKVSESEDVFRVDQATFSRVITSSKQQEYSVAFIGFATIYFVIYIVYSFFSSIERGNESNFFGDMGSLILWMFGTMVAGGLAGFTVSHFLPTHDLTWLGNNIVKLARKETSVPIETSLERVLRTLTNLF